MRDTDQSLELPAVDGCPGSIYSPLGGDKAGPLPLFNQGDVTNHPWG